MSILTLDQAADANLISALTPSQFNQLDADVRNRLMANARARAERDEIGFADIPAEVERQMRALQAAAPLQTYQGGQPVSMLSNALAKVGISKNVQRGITGAVVSAIPGGSAIKTGLSLLSQPRGGGSVAPAGSQAFAPALGAIAGAIGRTVARGSGGAIVPSIGSALGGMIPSLIPGLSPSGSGSGCGCHGGNGRDPCTGQKTSSQRAPDATFFGGCCPPGRVLRRQPWARDICIKKPRMNVFNPAALARADRRLTGFARRSTVMLRDMGFQISRQRKVKVGKKGRRR